MKKISLWLVIIFLITFSGCGHKKHNPVKTEDSTIVYSKPDKITTFIANLSINQSKPLYKGRAPLEDISWSGDEKYVTCRENIVDDTGTSVGYSMHLYKTLTKDEITLPSEMNDPDFKFKAAFWVDKENIFSVESNTSPTQKEMYSEYNVISKKLRWIENSEYDKYADRVMDKEQHLMDRYIKSDQLSTELKSETGEEFTWAYISSDKSKFLYSTDNYKVLIYDLKAKKKKTLFYGFNIQWSPGENKILYYVPTKMTYDQLKVNEVYDSGMFDSYVYDIKENKSIKISNFAIDGFFSPFDNYLVYYKKDYEGLKAA